MVKNEELEGSKNDYKKKFEIEYSYIDFRMMVLGQKIRSFKDGEPQPKFDNLYYSEMIREKAQDERNDKFFLQKSVQKIIDS